MTTITVIMIDHLTEELARVERTIHIGNICVPDNVWNCDRVATDDAVIRAALTRWIDDRACQQHDTILELESYRINR